MELGLRELLVIAGLLIIGAILLDGVRRYRRQKNTVLRMDLDLTGSLSGDPFNAELPTGGARAVDIAAGDMVSDNRKVSENSRASVSDNVPVSITKNVRGDYGARDLFGSTINGDFSDEEGDESTGLASSNAASSEASRHQARPLSGVASQHVTAAWQRGRPRSYHDKEGMVHGARAHRSSVLKNGSSRVGNSRMSNARMGNARMDKPALASRTVSSGEVRRTQAETALSANDAHSGTAVGGEAASGKGMPRDILSITLLARPGSSFAGKHLAQVFIEGGLRYGEHDVFHYYSLDRTMQEKPLISVTNGLKPGTFDLSQLDAFSTTAISLYLPLPGPADPEAAFSRFLTLADELGRKLGAKLCDAHKKPLTQGALMAMHTRLERVCGKEKHENTESEMVSQEQVSASDSETELLR